MEYFNGISRSLFLDATATGIIDLENHQAYILIEELFTIFKSKVIKNRSTRTCIYKTARTYTRTEEYIRRYKAGIKAKQARGRQSQLNRLERIEKPFHRLFTF